MLLGALADLARRHEEQRVDAGKGGFQGFGAGIIRLADIDAEAGRLGWRASQPDDRFGRLAFQFLDDEPAEMARDSGDGDSHVMAPI